MYEKYHASKYGDFQTRVNSFTQGLRELPTDYVARVKNFLAEYLGSPQHPVPFGGRVRDFALLDTWLSEMQATPYLLLAAPAGRGKSALLLHWCQQLFTRRDLAIAYFPVSIRFRTNLAGVVFPSLAALLARLHGEQVPTDPNMPEEVWRGLFADYIARPLPDGRQLVLVLDGVDEAADWVADANLFPLEPPRGLRIVLSARYLANDQDANAWLKRLGWSQQGIARTLELHPLDRTGIASVLTQMGFPLDLLGTRVNIVSELYRLSEGDPLLVRLYVEDLWERGEAAVRLQPEDLRAIRPGLAGYFERWWKEQRLLWSDDAPQREASAQIVLNLLAGALGPLNREDLLSLVPDDASFGSDNIAQHVAPLARFVTGDGTHQGYVFSHPRLGNYFLEERLSEQERQQVEQRFLTWGKQTLLALNTGKLAPEHASTYIVQYYGAHLERAHASVSALLELVNDGWRHAWEKLDQANAGFLNDVERAWRAAERENRAATDTEQLPIYLADEIRCLLSQVSVNSLTSNISPRLMLEAVKTGVWTPAQGLASIRLISDLTPRARELVGLAPYVAEPLRSDILQEALDTLMSIKDEYARLDALVELAPGFSQDLLWQTLDTIPAIEDEADRAGVLAELAPALAPYPALLDHTLHLIEEITEEEYRSLALEGLAPHFSTEQQAHVLQLIRNIEEDRYRATALTALLPHLPQDTLEDILQEVHNQRDGLSRIRLLAELVTHLPDSARTTAIQETQEQLQIIDDREYRVEVLVKLAPFLPEDDLRQALQEIQLLWDESYRARALSDLIRYIPKNLLPELQLAALELKSEEYRTQVILQLLPHLPANLVEPMLDIVQATWDEGRRAELLVQLAPYTTEELLPNLLQIASTIVDHGYRVWLLAELEALSTKKLDKTHDDMLAAFKAIRDPEERLQTLLAIISRLSDNALSALFREMLPEIFGFNWRLHNNESRTHIISKLAARLPVAWLPRILEEIQALGDEAYQVQTLVALAPRIYTLTDMLDIVRAMKDREKRGHVLEVLVSSLPDEHKSERVQEMLQILQVIKDEATRAHFVTICTPHLPATLSDSSVGNIIADMRKMQDEKNQMDILQVLALHFPEHQIENVLDIVQMMGNEEKQSQMLELLIPRIPAHLFPRLLDMIKTFRSERWQTRVLTAAVAHVPQSSIVGLLETMRGRDEDAGILRALIPYVPESAFPLLWKTVQALPHEGRRALVIGTLAVHMPIDFFPQFWEALLAFPKEDWQLWILRTLGPHVSDELFIRIWSALLSMNDTEKRVRIQTALLPYVPEAVFPSIWSDVLAIAKHSGARPLEAVASRVPKDFFLEFFTTLQAQSPQGIRMPILKDLVSRIPEDFFPQFFAIVQSISSEEPRVFLLIELTPHVPERFFSLLFEAAQEVKARPSRRKLLMVMASHVPESFLAPFWTIVRQMNDIERISPIQILASLLPVMTQDFLLEAATMILEIPISDQRLMLLETLFSLLSENKRQQMLNTLFFPLLSQEPVPMNWDARTLTTLVSYLPRARQLAVIPTLLQMSLRVRAEEERVLLLKNLAPHIPETLLSQLLEGIWSFTMNFYRAMVWETLLPTLSENGWALVIDQTLSQLRATSDPDVAREMLKIAGTLDAQARHIAATRLYPILHEELRLLAQHERRDALPILATLIPIVHTLSGEDAIVRSVEDTLEVGRWWP